MILTHKHCEKARQVTGTNDPDSEIISQFNSESEETKEKVAKELSAILENDESSLGMGLYEISAKYFMTYPVIFCIFKEWQSKNR